MAFLPALAAAGTAGTVGATAGAAALAKGAVAAGAAGTASAALGAGLSAGTILGTGAATSGILGGLGLNALGGMASTLPAAALAKGAAAPGILSALPKAGIFAKASPALGGLSSLTPMAAKTAPGLLQTAGMSPLGGMQPALTSAARVAPNLVGQNQALMEFSRQGLGQNLPQIGPKLAGPADSLAFKPVVKEAPFLNTFSEGAALPGVTSNLPGATLGNVAGGPAVPGVTSGLPVGTTQVPLVAGSTTPIESGASFLRNAGNFLKNPSMDAAIDYAKEHPYATAGGLYGLYSMMQPKYKPPETSKGMIRPYKFQRTSVAEGTEPPASGGEQVYLRDEFTPLAAYEAPGPEYEKAASGGIMGLAVGGPVEQRAAMDSVGNNMMYPQSQYQTPIYSNPMLQNPVPSNVIRQDDEGPNAFTDAPTFAEGGEAKTEGGYKYAFDPKTQTFTQLSVPTVAAQPQGRGQGLGQGQGYTRYTGDRPLDPNKDDYYYVPGSMAGQGYFMARGLSGGAPTASTGAKISGGISALSATPFLNVLPSQTSNAVMGPPVPAPVQTAPNTPTPVQTTPNIPAYQSPEERLGLTDFYAMMNRRLAQQGGYAAGGSISDLGGYSDGGRLLKGPGDGVSDSIPAVIGQRQPARLADGEFVVPARIVSELGNGSTEAGARKLYAMMDRVQKARKKSVGKNKVAANTKADKHLPA